MLYFNLRREEWSLATIFIAHNDTPIASFQSQTRRMVPCDDARYRYCHLKNLFQSQTRRMVPCDTSGITPSSISCSISISDEKNGPLRLERKTHVTTSRNRSEERRV